MRKAGSNYFEKGRDRGHAGYWMDQSGDECGIKIVQ